MSGGQGLPSAVNGGFTPWCVFPCNLPVCTFPVADKQGASIIYIYVYISITAILGVLRHIRVDGTRG